MSPPARLLDLTRLVSRLGKGKATGVDRVEAAYLAHLLALPDPVFALLRSKVGFMLLDRAGMARFNALYKSQGALPTPDLLSRLMRRSDPVLAAAETAARQLSIARCFPSRLPHLLRRYLPKGFTYLNTGHANLTEHSLSAIRTGGAGAVAVLIHDTIPLDHPEFARPDMIQAFRKKIAATSAHADLVIHSAMVTRTQTEKHFAEFGRVPKGITAPLGVTTPCPAKTTPREKPYFVALGTIEPRKNHALLLDIWERMHRDLPEAEIPHLFIIGRRGWLNVPVFARLDSLPFMNKTVFERAGLPDDEVAGLLASSQGLLFPSFVEGYGLPPLEAADLGTAVIVPPLPIYRETLGNYPVYAALDDSYSWMETIIRLKGGAGEQEHRALGQTEMARQAAFIPRWGDHFNIVLNSV
jgi:glycosyltransferase involved in cell wall biosynthesis